MHPPGIRCSKKKVPSLLAVSLSEQRLLHSRSASNVGGNDGNASATCHGGAAERHGARARAAAREHDRTASQHTTHIFVVLGR
jgi:hypothetical protein